MTNAKQPVECQARDRPGFDSTRTLGRIEDITDTEQESCSIVREFGDISFEENRIAYIEAMILSRVIPPLDGQSNRLEAAFMKLPRRTMNELIATQGKLYEAFRKQAAIVLKGLEDSYIS